MVQSLKATDCVVVLVTCGSLEDAQYIARTVVESCLAACVNIVPQVYSIYVWEGSLQEDTECLMILKTKVDGLEPLKQKVLAMHPYTLPEFIVLPLTEGSDAYLNWVRERVRP